MAKAIIKGRQHPVRVDEVNANNYGVSVLTNEDVPDATVNVMRRPAALQRYKIHANDAAAAVRQALKLMKASGEIDDFELEPSELPPEPPPEKPAAAQPPETPAAAEPPETPAAAKPAATEPPETPAAGEAQKDEPAS